MKKVILLITAIAFSLLTYNCSSSRPTMHSKTGLYGKSNNRGKFITYPSACYNENTKPRKLRK